MSGSVDAPNSARFVSTFQTGGIKKYSDEERILPYLYKSSNCGNKIEGCAVDQLET
jgi:hypothetical protein